MRNSRSLQSKSQRIGYVYILPWVIGFLVFQFYPLLSSLYYSFTDFTMFNNPAWQGIGNYTKIFASDKTFRNSLMRTFIYVLIGVPVKLLFAFFIAMLLNMKLKFINFFRTVYYLPSIVGGSVAISILWRLLFIKEGAVNRLLGIMGIAPISWLGSPKYALFTISLIIVWQFGSSMVLFLAGLKQIPEELYESATVDGAGKIRSFFSITLPLITPTIFFNLIMQMISTFQDFTGAMVVTNGGPLNSTYLYALMLYDQGFKYFRMGYASALSWVLFAIIMIFTALIFKSSPMWVHYQDGGDF